MLTPIQMRAAMALCGLLALSACGSAALVRQPPTPTPVFHTTEEADLALKEATRERAAAEAHYQESERACYQRFFVNNCIDDAKELQRATLVRLRAIEVEAGRYQREAAVNARDQSLAEAALRAEQDAVKRSEQAATTTPVVPAPEAPRAARHAAVDPEAAYAKKLAANKAKEAAGAKQRAANAAAYQQKQLDAQQHQRDVAARKAAREAASAASAASSASGKASAGNKASAPAASTN